MPAAIWAESSRVFEDSYVGFEGSFQTYVDEPFSKGLRV